MRLTLRTMLAYLDEILHPEDAAVLGKKIEESDFAANLVHRIRNATRRLRLGAPKVHGKGIGADANTVSEYLDNTLAQERVPEYEKTCLESDVYLAEVASCHQILTMVLGEPAEVEPAMRRRMYRLQRAATATAELVEQSVAPVKETKVEPKRSEPQPSVPTAPERAMTVDETDKVTRSHREVPDYLRPGSRRPFLPLALTLMLAFLVAIVALRAMGPFNKYHPLYRMFAAAPTPEIAVVEHAEDPVAPEPVVPPISEAPAPETPVETVIGDNLPPIVEPTPEPAQVEPAVEVNRPEEPVPSPEQDPPMPVIEPEQPVEDPPNPLAPLPTEPPVEPGSDPAKTDEPIAEPIAEPMPVDPLPSDPVVKQPEKIDSPPETTTVEVEITELGRVISEDDVLIRHSAEKNSWLRLPARTTLRSGDRLLVLPASRPQVLLSPPIQLFFAGPAAITLRIDANTGDAQLDMAYGRFVVANVGAMQAKVGLRVGDRVGTIHLDNADAVAAVEVRNFLPPGTDPELSPANKVVEIFATGGPVNWQETAVESVRIEPGQVGGFVDNGPLRLGAVEALPAWTDGKDISDIDQLASPELTRAIVPDREVRLTLQEFTSHRRAELRALSTRCLSYFDNFETFFSPDGVLQDELQRASWKAHFAALQQAIARGKTSAVAVRQSLEKFRGDDAQNLYRMIWGYSPEQLEGGQNLQLIQWLDHEAMDYRVLAYANLDNIAGWTLGYLPHYNQARRKSRIAEWRRRLDAGEIKYKEVPTPLPAHTAAPKEE